MTTFEQYFKEYCVKTNLPADSPFTTACKKMMEDAWDAGYEEGYSDAKEFVI